MSSDKKHKFGHADGFALPTILIASIVMLAVLLVSVVSAAATRSALDAQYYNKIAQNAADAGVAYAKECISASGDGMPTWTGALKPNQDCMGVVASTNPPSINIVESGSVNSTFEASVQRDADNRVVAIDSVGIVDLLRSDGTIWRQYKQNSHIIYEYF